MNDTFALPHSLPEVAPCGERCSVIIRCFASKSLSNMQFKAHGLKQAAIAASILILAGLAIGCGSYSPSSKVTSSGLKFRAFVSQDVSIGVSPAFPAGVPAGLFIIDAMKDVQSPAFISASSFNWSPGQMGVSANKKITLAYSSATNSIALVNNASESARGSITLPGSSESIAISPDASFGYAALNNAAVVGQSPGALAVLDLNAGNIAFTIPVPNAHYVVESHNGNRLLVFSDNSDNVTVIATGNIPPCTSICGGPSPPPCPLPSDGVSCSISGFDRPISAVFSSDDNTAYVLNCGAECGGQTASIQAIDMTKQTAIGPRLAVQGATVGLLNGNTLYVAGTPGAAPDNACVGSTAATTCGRLNVVNVNSMTVTNSQVITDGYHNRIDLSQNGQLFIGARNCSSINNPATEVRGCLSIFNTLNPAVVIPPDIGDVTGIQAISNRDVVYVVENGELRIYDTTTDKLGPTQIDLSGQAIDVKQVDF